MKLSNQIFTIPALLFMVACHGGGMSEASLSEEAGNASSGEIVLTREQFDGSGMKTGAPLPMFFSNEISANGNLGSTLDGRAKINTLIPGRIRQLNFSIGDQVEKGEVLFSLQSHEIILLQQEYAEVVQQLGLLLSDYERLKSLSEEKIVAQKDFLKTESEYKTMQAKAEGLKARLKMINIDPALVEKGTILSEVTVISPIHGVVTRQELVLGQFIEPQITVMEVVDTRKLQLNIRVFENDLSGLAEGQVVKFYTPGHEERVFEATLSHIGKSIDPETQTVQCIARIKPEDRGAFVYNLFVESRIITCQRETLAIPESALIREADRDFVWIRVDEKGDQITFKKVPVQTGVTRGGYTEILEEGLSDILLEGAYSLVIEE
ncbi:MAG: efflux RND transporter periplasmic adaptor subunit [Bacteroidales bacterium]